MDNMSNKLPLGIFKQAVMKLDSFITDVHEIREDDDISDNNKEVLKQMSEMAGVMQATLVNMINKEIEEEEFLSEQIDMDGIEEYPGSGIKDEDILDIEI